MKRKSVKEKTVIGWREYVDFPEWGIHGIRAKVDTGARTSSLHVDDVKILKNGLIRFSVTVSNKEPAKRKKVVARIHRRGRVVSSTGHSTHRWYVKAIIRIGKLDQTITLNLTDRSGMNFPMLLGRTALGDDFLVDVDRSFLLSEKKKDKK